MTGSVELGPGVHEDVPAAVYHADPVEGGSLSHSESQLLLPPSVPYKLQYLREHRDSAEATRAMELGSAVHRELLGVGPGIERIDADSYRTNAAKDQRDTARAAGRIPLLPDEVELVDEMAAAVRNHPRAGPLFGPGPGQVLREVVLVWRDPATGTMCRAMLDLVRLANGRCLVIDYKSAFAIDDEAVGKAAANHDYHGQGDWYVDGVIATGLHHQPAMVFVFQEKDPPYLVRTVQFDHVAAGIAAARNAHARQIHAHCTSTGVWPAYPPEPAIVRLPSWYERREGY